jgi:hypothetical protein
MNTGWQILMQASRMRRNIFGGVALFALITGVAVGIARLPDTAAPLTSPAVATNPATIMLEPSGDFVPRATAPVFTVRANELKSVFLRYYRLQDQALMLRLYRGITQGSLSPIAVARLLTESTTPLATARLPLKNGSREITWSDVNTAPTLPPGFYLATVAATPTGDAQAATWFLRSDLHVMALNDTDGWHVICQNLAAHPAPVTLNWFGFDTVPVLANDICATSDHIPTSAKIPANAALQLLFGADAVGNLAFVPLRGALKAPVDQTSENILATDRNHYLPGQNVMALAYGSALTNDKITLALQQPNGLKVQVKPILATTAQTAWVDFALPPDAPAGTWQIQAFKDGIMLRQIQVAVGQEAAGLRTSLRVIDRHEQNISLVAKMTAADNTPLNNHAATLRTEWNNIRQLPEISPDYAFGGYDNPAPQPQIAANWVIGGDSVLKLQLPPPPKVTYPVQAQLRLEPWPETKIIEAQSARITFPTHPWALGIHANFGDATVREGAAAEFKTALFKTSATTAAPPSLAYELVTEHRSFRWFFTDGKWDYKSDVAAVTIAHGAVATEGVTKGQISVTAPRGQYRLDVFTPDRALTSSWRFQIGETPLEPPPPSVLPLRLNTATVPTQIIAHGRSVMTMIAADTKLRTIQTDSGSTDRDVTFAMHDSTTTGTNILVLATDNGADTATGRAHGEIWLPPQPHTAPWGVAAWQIPKELRAGTTVKIGIQFATHHVPAAFAQIIAIPTENNAPAYFLTADVSAPQPRRFAFISNIFPALSLPLSSSNNPPVFQDTFPASSTRSSIVPLGNDGKLEIALTLPARAGATTLHLLTWTAEDIHEQVQNLTITDAPRLIAPVPIPANDFNFVLPNWSCQEPVGANHALDLTAYHSAPQGKHAAMPELALLSPVALPDFPEAWTSIFQERSATTATSARMIVAVQDFAATLNFDSQNANKLRRLQSRLWNGILQRQQGDGGIAAYPDTPSSDLSATALTLQAWQQAAPEMTDNVRLDAMKNFMQRRLSNPWNAENEMPGRADGFYALSLFGQNDAAALRYFIEKFGNQIRDAVREAELAAALAEIKDQEKSQAFVARAMAQLPSLRNDDPGRVWQVLAIMAQHATVPAEELAKQAHAMPLLAAQTPWQAAVSLHGRAAIARALPAWEIDDTGNAPVRERGIHRLSTAETTHSAIRLKQGPALYFCADHAVTHPTHGNTKTTPVLTRTLYSLFGKKIAPTDLRRDNRYVLVVASKNWRNGSSEVDVPLPPGLAYRAAIPGEVSVAAYAWLDQVDTIAAAVAYAPTMNSQGVTLAVTRDHDGDGRIALLVEATGTTNALWPATTLTQSSGVSLSAEGMVKIR